MGSLRSAVSVLLKDRHGMDLMVYLMDRRTNGVSLRKIAFDLYDLTGVLVSHQAVADWIKEG